MPATLETVVVPWFSRQEWLEVYQGTYSHDVERWKEARDTMLVWQARVKKLPIGVDLTLPLLQSKIVDADPYVDADVKFIMQGTALQRFVSNVVKLPQTMYYNSQNMHTLAANIGLPAHLVDLRNEIIHGDAGWAGGCTISEALETSFKWIKGYYWTPEVWQMKTRQKRDARPRKKSSVEWSYLLRTLNSYSKFAFVSKKDAISGEVEAVIKGIQDNYPTNPNDCIEAVVTRLLAPSYVEDIICQPENRSKCGCIFTSRCMEVMQVILNPLLENEGSSELLFSSLLSKIQSTENKVLMEWTNLLVRSLLNLPVVNGEEGYCKEHSLNVETKDPVNWKKVISKLVDLGGEWAIDLALRIVNSSETGIPESQAKQITNLLMLAKSVGEDKIQTAGGTNKNWTAGDDENQTADDDENQAAGGDNKNQTAGGDDENKTADGDIKNQTGDGDIRNQTAGGDNENQAVGGDNKQTAGSCLHQTAGGDNENQTDGEDNENQTDGEDDMNQTDGGDDKYQTAGEDDENQTTDEDDGNQTDISNESVNDDLFDVDAIIEHINKHSVDNLKVSEKVNTSTLASPIICTRTPLGILPHQVDNKQFYKELLLHYPDDRSWEPPLKRKKA